MSMEIGAIWNNERILM